MSQLSSFYHLYCLNMNCRQSIYWNSVETKTRFTADNLTATHLCVYCGQPLFSAMDIEIKQMTALAGVTAGKTYPSSSH
jgi:hypothetical protein